jgi:hypothetical protein
MSPLVKSWLASGMTQKQFCSNHELPVHILVYLVGRYRNSQPGKAIVDKAVATASKTIKKVVAADSYSGFIRLSPPPPTPSPAPAITQLPAGSVEVVLPTSAFIRFSATLPASYFKELLSP